MNQEIIQFKEGQTIEDRMNELDNKLRQTVDTLIKSRDLEKNEKEITKIEFLASFIGIYNAFKNAEYFYESKENSKARSWLTHAKYLSKSISNTSPNIKLNINDKISEIKLK